MLNFHRVKSGLVILLQAIAITTQPLLAIPAACQMSGGCETKACAACCAENPCCAPSQRDDATPVSAVCSLASVLIPTALPAAVTVPVLPARSFEFAAAGWEKVGHVPHPRALSCIQLIWGSRLFWKTSILA